jgi:hypothetical protein
VAGGVPVNSLSAKDSNVVVKYIHTYTI